MRCKGDLLEVNDRRADLELVAGVEHLARDSSSVDEQPVAGVFVDQLEDAIVLMDLAVVARAVEVVDLEVVLGGPPDRDLVTQRIPDR